VYLYLYFSHCFSHASFRRYQHLVELIHRFKVHRTNITRNSKIANMALTPLKSIMLAVRVCAGIFAGVGLALYAIIFVKVIDERFPANNTGLTALPIAGVSHLSDITKIIENMN